MLAIADTGLIVAFITRNDRFHRWAAKAFREHAPFHTCEVVIGEACSFFPDPGFVLPLIVRGDLVLDSSFVLAEELPHVLGLVAKYVDLPMDLADACLVRMTELHARCKVWTVDRDDFTTYRRHGRHAIPCEFPPV